MELSSLDLEILADRVAQKLGERLEEQIDTEIALAVDGIRDELDNREELTPYLLCDLMERMFDRMLRRPCCDLTRLRETLREVVNEPITG